MLYEPNAQNGAGANPSHWAHRLPVIVLALVGCAVSAYLTLYQWHVTASVWDPLFGSVSSEAVLSSTVSRALPLPDATLGALAYLIEAVVTSLGGTDRWRSMPWLVMGFGLVLARAGAGQPGTCAYPAPRRPCAVLAVPLLGGDLVAQCLARARRGLRLPSSPQAVDARGASLWTALRGPTSTSASRASKHRMTGDVR